MKRITAKIHLIFCLVLAMSPHSYSGEVFAAESTTMQDDSKITSTGETTDESQAAYQGEGSIYLGFRLVDVDYFSGAGEYEYDESSPTIGLQLETFPLPHRYFIQGDYLGTQDYYGDFGYAYGDLFQFRDQLIGLHHNLDHYDYQRPGEPPGITYEDLSIGDENFIDFMRNDLFLRLKTPDFPLHTFIEHRYVEREGSIQERFLNGYFGSLDKIAQSREIDWESNDLTLGINSHLGPVELEYAYNKFEFNPGAGSIMYDFFPAGRPPDIYPHNVIPETESYGNTLKLHTSYTGQIVATATLGNEESTNNYSGAESDAWRGAFDLQWMPDPAIGMFFRYRHLETDKENPRHTILNGQNSRTTYEVRPPISTEKDLFSLSARYRVLKKLTLKGNYQYELRERSEVEEWFVLPEDSDIHRVNLSAWSRPRSDLKLKAVYEYQYCDNPAYNIVPDHSNKIRLNASYTPTSRLTALLDYSLTFTNRDDLLYVNGTTVVESGERDGRTDHGLGSVSYLLTRDTSVTASWAYNRWKTEQDTAYSRWNTAGTSVTELPYYDLGAPYTDEAHTFALSLYSKLTKTLKLKTGLSYTMAESEYLPTPSYLTVFQTKETTETIAVIELIQKFLEDWEVGLKCKAGFFDDEYSGGYADPQDNELYLTLLTLKRYF